MLWFHLLRGQKRVCCLKVIMARQDMAELDTTRSREVLYFIPDRLKVVSCRQSTKRLSSSNKPCLVWTLPLSGSVEKAHSPVLQSWRVTTEQRRSASLKLQTPTAKRFLKSWNSERLKRALEWTDQNLNEHVRHITGTAHSCTAAWAAKRECQPILGHRSHKTRILFFFQGPIIINSQW